MCSLGLTRVLFFERGQREKASFRGRSLNMNPAKPFSIEIRIPQKESRLKKDYEQGFDKVESL